ncbi:hypothetical protein [Microbacterium sp. B19]|uniref:hypothetical protein n=1 Tax=Microbacterium sp. B19 TaxID=96765 RepID=UPI000346067A|nr:hypothetical protein [Microbacterium sp. B19]
MESLPMIATAVGLVLSGSASVLGGMKWMLDRVEKRTSARFDRVDQRFDRLEARTDERFAEVDRRLQEVGGLLTEVKIAVARLEGPHPPFLFARG